MDQVTNLRNLLWFSTPDIPSHIPESVPANLTERIVDDFTINGRAIPEAAVSLQRLSSSLQRNLEGLTVPLFWPPYASVKEPES